MNTGNRNPELTSERGLRAVAMGCGSDFLNLFRGQLGAVATMVIDRRCDRLKVLGVPACPDATQVIKLESIWNRAVNRLVGKHVSEPVFSSLGVAGHSVSVPGRAELPDMARRFVPAIFDEVVSAGLSVVMAFEKVLRLSLYPVQAGSRVRRVRHSTTAAALAKTNLNVIVCGLHSLTFNAGLRVGHGPGRFNVAGLFAA